MTMMIHGLRFIILRILIRPGCEDKAFRLLLQLPFDILQKQHGTVSLSGSAGGGGGDGGG